MLIVASGSEQHYLFKRDVVLPDGGVVSLDGSYEAFIPSTVTVSGLPDTLFSISVTQSLGGRARALLSVPHFPSSALINGVQTFASSMPVPRDGITMRTLEPFTNELSVQHVIDWSASTATTSIDYSAMLVRPYTTRPTYDPTSTTVHWTESSTGRIANTVMVGLAWAQPQIGGGYNWYAISARGEPPRVRLPLLPVQRLVVPANATIFMLANISVDGGYERIRQRLLGRWAPDHGAWPIDADSGRVVYQTLQDSGFE
jgi:hypothetical protein